MRDYDISISSRTEDYQWEPTTDLDHYRVCDNKYICENACRRLSSMPLSIAHELLKCSQCDLFDDSGI